jgi:hypothetical protein
MFGISRKSELFLHIKIPFLRVLVTIGLSHSLLTVRRHELFGVCRLTVTVKNFVEFIVIFLRLGSRLKDGYNICLLNLKKYLTVEQTKAESLLLYFLKSCSPAGKWTLNDSPRRADECLGFFFYS